MTSKLWAVISVILHLDVHLNRLIAYAGYGTYGILFLIIFAETGLVVTPFLPGDSLLFAAGAIAATGSLNIYVLVGVLMVAAILGDSVNYALGSWLGQRVYQEERLLGIPVKRKHLDDAQAFYTKYGTKAIALSRFLPILRTLVPFMAGFSRMPYQAFITSNVIGGICWVGLLTLGGYSFGNIPVVKANFGLVVAGIIVVSLLPVFIEFIRTSRLKR